MGLETCGPGEWHGQETGHNSETSGQWHGRETGHNGETSGSNGGLVCHLRAALH